MRMEALGIVALLAVSNMFMTYAWYGHLKTMRGQPLYLVVLLSWLIAFFEYALQVPANRWGSAYFSIFQLKMLQEVCSIIVFAGFAVFYMQQSLRLDYLWAALCLVGAVYFIFRGQS